MSRHAVAGWWWHRQSHPHLYLLVLAGLIAIALLLLRGDSTVLAGSPG